MLTFAHLKVKGEFVITSSGYASNGSGLGKAVEALRERRYVREGRDGRFGRSNVV